MALIDDLKSTHISISIGLGIAFIACILNTVTLGSLGWVTVQSGIYKTEFGLFRFCADTPTTSVCQGYGQIEKSELIQVAAATRTIGTLLTIAGIIVIVLFVLAFHGTQRGVYKAGFGCLVVAVVSNIAGVALFAGFFSLHGYASFYGVMFKLACSGTAILFVGVVILGVAMRYLASSV